MFIVLFNCATYPWLNRIPCARRWTEAGNSTTAMHKINSYMNLKRPLFESGHPRVRRSSGQPSYIETVTWTEKNNIQHFHIWKLEFFSRMVNACNCRCKIYVYNVYILYTCMYEYIYVYLLYMYSNANPFFPSNFHLTWLEPRNLNLKLFFNLKCIYPLLNSLSKHFILDMIEDSFNPEDFQGMALSLVKHR